MKENDFANPYAFKASQLYLLAKDNVISAESFGMTPKEMEKIYVHGKKLYDAGKYKDALAVFSLLSLIDSRMPAYIYGMASCCFMLKNYEDAKEAFLEYGALVPSDPVPYFYVALCYEQKNDDLSTMIALQATITRADDQPRYQEIKHRSKLILDSLKEKRLKLSYTHEAIKQ